MSGTQFPSKEYFEHHQADCDMISNKVMLAYDYMKSPNEKSFRFQAFKSYQDAYQYIFSFPLKQRNFNLVYQAGQATKIKLDIDVKSTEIAEEYFDTELILDCSISTLRDTFVQCYRIVLPYHYIAVYQSHREDKISFHFEIQNYYVTDAKQNNFFAQHFKKNAPQWMREHPKIIDMTVYNKNKPWRLPENIKCEFGVPKRLLSGKDFISKLASIHQYFITDVSNLGPESKLPDILPPLMKEITSDNNISLDSYAEEALRKLCLNIKPGLICEMTSWWGVVGAIKNCGGSLELADKVSNRDGAGNYCPNAVRSAYENYKKNTVGKYGIIKLLGMSKKSNPTKHRKILAEYPELITSYYCIEDDKENVTEVVRPKCSFLTKVCLALNESFFICDEKWHKVCQIIKNEWENPDCNRFVTEEVLEEEIDPDFIEDDLEIDEDVVEIPEELPDSSDQELAGLSKKEIKKRNQKRVLLELMNASREKDELYLKISEEKREKHSKNDFNCFVYISQFHRSDEEILKMWNSVNRWEHKYRIGTLVWMLKKENPERVKYVTKKYGFDKRLLFLEPEDFEDGVAEIINEQYITNIDSYFGSKKVLVIASPMMTGKTQAISDYMLKNGIRRCLCLTPRQSFAMTISERLELNDYRKYRGKAIPGVIQRRLAISIESLHKLTIFDHELLIIDESETVLAQTSSDTMETGFRRQSMYNLERVIRESDRIIVSDAFISQRSLNIFYDMDIDLNVLYNTYQPHHRTVTYYPFDGKSDDGINTNSMFYRSLLTDLIDRKKRLFCFFSSKAEAEGFYNHILFIKKTAQMQLNMGMYNEELIRTRNLNILKYTSGGRNTLGSNVNDEWKVDILICTSVITVGIDFNVEWFHKAYLYASARGGPLVRDIFQSLMRPRHLIDNVLVYTDGGSKYFGKIERKNLLEEKKRLLNEKNYDVLVDQYDNSENLVVDDKNWIFNLSIHNELENSLTRIYFDESITKFLKKCGYTFVEDQQEVTQEASQKYAEKELISYWDLECVNAEEVAKLKNKKLCGNISNIELQTLKKYFWQKKFIDPSVQQVGDLYDKCYVDGQGEIKDYDDGANIIKYHIDNLSLEKVENVLKLLSYDIVLNNDSTIDKNLISRKLAQLDFVRRMCCWFGLKNTLDDSVKITEERVCSFEFDMVGTYKLFDMKYRGQKRNGRSEKIASLNKILEEWCGSKIQGTNIRKGTGKNRKRVWVYNITNTLSEHFDNIKETNFENINDLASLHREK